ncbi:unnamed protein product [Malus baccata var. baccata]
MVPLWVSKSKLAFTQSLTLTSICAFALDHTICNSNVCFDRNIDYVALTWSTLFVEVSNMSIGGEAFNSREATLLKMGGIMVLLLLIITLHVNLGHGDANMTMRCTDKEREALLAFKQGLIMDEHSQVLFSSWGTEAAKQDCCRWEGVSCDNQTGHVVRLDLSYHVVHLDLGDDYYLQGHVGNLTNLQFLDLGYNDFSGNVENLNWLPRLSSLTYLDLSDNNLSNVFYWPEAVNKLPKLTTLTLQNCSIPSPPVRSTLSNINSSKSLSSIHLSFNRLSTSSIFLWMSNYSTSLVDLDLSFNQLEGAEPHSFSTLCSLQSLDLSGNNLSGQFSRFVQILSTCAQNSLEWLSLGENQLAGLLPDLTNFLSLTELLVSYNQLSGRIPESIGQMSKLENLGLGMNALEGLISESHFSELSRLRELDLSSNSLVLNFQSNWTPPFQLNYISLGSCKMGPYFPKWLQTQNEYSFLNISNAGIVDILPSWFWGTTRYVTSIILSHNQIGEIFTNLTVDFVNYPEVHLRSNQIEGQIPATLSHASYLDLSNNNISGSISFLCASGAMRLRFLNLSYNNLSGELPECLTRLGNLVMLDLSSNALSGKIPSTIGSLFGIETLKLRSNEFVGELPLSLKNCTSLMVLDLADNQLTGSIPKWLGASFQKLVILMLSSNHFNGSLPPQLCDLIYIQILDVSVNNISGGIPNCLKKLTTLAQKGNSSLTVEHSYERYDKQISWLDIYVDDEIFTWKGSMQVYRNTLGLVRSIDFSSNRLTGEIPSEISHLVGLVSLNLSRNQLTGQITPDIGKLESLDSLDLSRNHIDGRIPTSLARISRLGLLDLSHNNLIGKIPTGTQLQSFDPSFYDGNPQLCGPPLKKPCDIEETGPDQVSNEEDKDGQLIRYGFYISMVLGFFVGFWGVCGSLIFIREWRYTYFKFLNSLNDWLYVRVVLIKRKLTDA